MNNMQIFNNEEFGQVRTLMVNGEPWFVGKDVAEALGYSEPRSAVSKKVDKEDRGVAKIEMTKKERDLYDALCRDSYAELENGEHITATTVLTKLLRLQQLTGGFLVEDDAERPEQVSTVKLDALKDIITDYVVEGGKKLVVFARFMAVLKSDCPGEMEKIQKAIKAIMDDERAKGGIERLKDTLFQTYSLERFLDAACHLRLRIYYEAYAPYWISKCSKVQAPVGVKRMGVEGDACYSLIIESVENAQEQDVLFYKYIKGMAWWEIAEKMNYSDRWVRKLHAEHVRGAGATRQETGSPREAGRRYVAKSHSPCNYGGYWDSRWVYIQTDRNVRGEKT